MLKSEVFPQLKSQLEDLNKKISIISEFPDYFKRIEKKLDIMSGQVTEVKSIVKENQDLIKDLKVGSLKKDIQLSKTFEDFDKIFKSISEGLDKHPTFDMGVTIDGKTRTYKIEPKGDKPIYFKLKFKFPNDIKLNEKLNDYLKTRKPLILEEKEFIEAILSSDDIPKMDNNWKISRIEFRPPPFPPQRPYKIEVPESNFSLDYVLIGLNYLDDEKLILVSKNFPVEFEFIAFKNQKAVTVNSHFSTKDKSLRDELLMNDFLEALNKSKKILIKDLERDKYILEGDISDKKIENLYHPQWHDLLKKLTYIEKRANITFGWPINIIETDIKIIYELHKILGEGKIIKEMNDVSFEVTVSALKNLIDIYKKDGKISNFAISSPNVHVELFGKRIDLGPGKRKLPDLKFFDECSAIENNIKDKTDSEFIRIKLIPVKEKLFIDEFSNFIKDN